MEIGFGILHLPPSEFWQMSLPELYAAIDGVAEYSGSRKEKPLSRDELQDLMERYPD